MAGGVKDVMIGLIMAKKIKKKKKKSLKNSLSKISENNRTVPKAVDSWWGSFAKVCDPDLFLDVPKQFKFDNPFALWQACWEYLVWVDDNPLLSEQINVYKGKAISTPVRKKRPATLEGLLLYIGISRTAWENFKDHVAFEECCERAELAIYVQKYEGAASGLLNPQIIARDLGLKDVREVNTNVSGELTTNEFKISAMFDMESISTKELRVIKKAIRKAEKAAEEDNDSDSGKIIEAELIED